MDMSRIHELLKLMEDHGLEELEIEEEGAKVRLKKEPKSPPVVAPCPAPPPQAAPGPAGGAPQSAKPGNTCTIASPIVGTFYRSPAPDAELFVEDGDPVEPDTVVCIVEAMKVMNEVRAEVTGTIQKVLVESGKPVEYGQPLFLVSRG